MNQLPIQLTRILPTPIHNDRVDSYNSCLNKIIPSWFILRYSIPYSHLWEDILLPYDDPVIMTIHGAASKGETAPIAWELDS